MNVAFNLRDTDLEQQFLAQALAAGFSGLPGHRALGGIRASIYNALSLSAVQTLTDFMRGFQQRAAR
jgi:phosphoserine aminotransferase